MVDSNFFAALDNNYIEYGTQAEHPAKKERTADSSSNKASTTKKQRAQCTVMLFKNDLRTLDNPALYYASKHCKDSGNSQLIGLFVFCEPEWRIHGYGDCKLALLAKSVNSLKARLLAEFNIPLFIVVESEPARIPETICTFCHQVGAAALFYNQQYEFDEAKRDRLMHDKLKRECGIGCYSFEDQCAVPPGRCKTQQGNQFMVFTPYKKCWLRLLEETDKRLLDMVPRPLSNSKECTLIHTVPLPTKDGLEFESEAFKRGSYLWDEDKINALADEFISQRATNYKRLRDFPIDSGTSSLSPYIALGMISVRQLLNFVLHRNHRHLSTGDEGLVCWVSELCWRDFYRNIIVVFPHVMKNKPFKLESIKIPWSNDREAFCRWTRGLTGFPIVDAGMRQLEQTGWMHNRLRMVTAMFLTKDLLINWRWGERYFSEHLVDADFASNNGGWQWSASTGTDSQPYFRIFNPLLQGKRFDPSGAFIRKWIPELSQLADANAVHDPHAVLGKEAFERLGYPAPIVVHDEARRKAIEQFKLVYSVQKQ